MNHSRNSNPFYRKQINMKKTVRQLIGAVLFAAAAMAADQPASKGPAVHADALPRPTAEQAQWQDYEIGVFYHYDMNAFKPGWDHRKYDDFPKPEIFNPTKLDTNQWMEVPKALGAKYAVLTATHGSGFMLWQSDAYPYVLEGKVGETWQKIGGGTCVGHKRIERITPVEVSAVRLNVLKSAATPLIRKLAVYNTQAS